MTDNDAPVGPTPPDFTRLYEPSYRQGSGITPRMAYWLWVGCIYLADSWRDTVDDPEPLLEYFPPLAHPYVKGDWLQRFIASFDAVADRLAEGAGDREQLATCTGDEFALHLVIDHAEASVHDGLLDAQTDCDALPDHGVDDLDFERVRDRLFLDHDVLVLFDPLMDGVEDPDSDVGRIERYANLHPRDWFKPFSSS